MKAFTKEQLEYLKQYEDNFHRAIELNYYRNMTRKTLDDIKAIYDAATGKAFGADWSCSHCILNFLKEVGKKFYKDMEEYKNNAAKLVEVLDEVFGEVPDIDPETPQKTTKTAAKKPQSKKK